MCAAYVRIAYYYLPVYLRAQFGGVHAFGYNSAESRKVNIFEWNLEHYEYIVGVGLTLADFGCDTPSSDCFGARRIILPGKKRTISRLPNFTKFGQNVDRRRDENFRNRILKILP